MVAIREPPLNVLEGPADNASPERVFLFDEEMQPLACYENTYACWQFHTMYLRNCEQDYVNRNVRSIINEL